MNKRVDRKKCKKIKKYTNILFNELKIKVTLDPRRDVVICNAGLLSGISELDVVSYFSHYGKIDCVIMVPEKSYCFVTFSDICSAIDCFSSEILPTENNLIKANLLILYVEEVPHKFDLYKKFSYIPPGVIILNDFITEAEELNFSSAYDIAIDKGQDLSHRKVKHYGYEFKYENNNVNKNTPLAENIPDDFAFLTDRIQQIRGESLIPWIPDQLTINCYMPGQGIPPHIDTHSAFEDPILSLSILSDVVMEFEKCDAEVKACVFIPRRSLLIMSGEARYYWRHGIIPRKSDVMYNIQKGLCTKLREKRISFTFRKIRSGECNCKYNVVCDSYLKMHTQLHSDETAAHIENKFVHKVYESISDHFSLTRHSPWPAIRNFLLSLPPGSIVFDIGSGNGKYFNINNDNYHFGGDTCNELNYICKDKGMEVIQFNCLSVPIRDNAADAVICIAVIHHLFKESRRLQALREIYRIMKVGGSALVYVWSKEQKSSHYATKNGKYTKEPQLSIPSTKYSNESGVILPIHNNKTEFKHNDVLVPWNLRLKSKESSQYLRYYHLFEEKELEKMCIEIGVNVIKSYYDDGNWCVLIKKS